MGREENFDISAEMRELSIPPERKAPSGTSLIMRSRTLRDTISSSSSKRSSSFRFFQLFSGVICRKSQYRSTCSSLPFSVSQCAGGNFRIEEKIEYGAGT